MVTALRLEERAVRRHVPQVRVVRGGVALRTLSAATTPVLLSIGLAGGLSPEQPAGMVVIPDRIDRESGESWPVDGPWAEALRAAARRLELAVADGPLVQTDDMVTGVARGELAARGYAAADMESASIAARAARVAAVRVILDGPMNEISPHWRRPAVAALDPRLWAQGYWLMRTAPGLARRAALVLAEALRAERVQGDVDPEV